MFKRKLFKRRKLLCPNCKKLSLYKIESRTAMAEFKYPKEIKVEYTEKYGVCKFCGEEIFVPKLEDKNMKQLEPLVLNALKCK